MTPLRRSAPTPRSRPGALPRLPPTLLLILALALPLAAQEDDAARKEDGEGRGEEAALVIREGSVARRQVVAMGRDVVIAGEAHSDVAAFDGSVEVTGSVVGDVIVLGGDVRLSPQARVGGDVFVLGGTVDSAEGASIEGRAVAHPTASAAWLTLLEGPSFGLSAASPLVIGTKLALMAAWMALALLLFAAAGREVMATSATIREEPFRSFLTGLTGVLALTLTAVAFGAVAPPLAGAPLVALVVLFALILKLWGMVAVFHALGARVAALAGRPRTLALNAATIGLVILGVAKFIPHLGAWVWTLASLIGIGASLTSKLGRREAWFRIAELERPA